MRVVAVADTHTREDSLGQIPDGDIFVHAGDLLRLGSLDELIAVSRWLRRLSHRCKIVIAGNSDWCFARDPEASKRVLGDDVIYLQDQETTIAGLTVWGSPWQPEYKNGGFNLPRGAALAEKWQLVPTKTDVLITHGPPRGLGDSVSGRNIGCDDLLRTVRRVRPALHLFGHVHGNGGVWRDDGVCFANVTTWAGARGATVLDIDPLTKVVTDVAVPSPDPAR